MNDNMPLNKKKKEEKIRKIVDASLVVFARDGYSKTNFTSISKECDVKRTQIYCYFTNVADIFMYKITDKLTQKNKELSTFDGESDILEVLLDEISENDIALSIIAITSSTLVHECTYTSLMEFQRTYQRFQDILYLLCNENNNQLTRQQFDEQFKLIITMLIGYSNINITSENTNLMSGNDKINKELSIENIYSFVRKCVY